MTTRICGLALLATTAIAPAQQPESQVACSNPEPIPIAYGQSTSGCGISPATDLDVFVFQGQVGEQVRLRLATQTNDLDPKIDIYDPANVLIASPACTGPWNGTCTFQHVEVLQAKGRYTLVVSDVGTDNTGSYVLQLERVPPVITPPGLLFGASVQDTISPTTDIDYFTVQGAANDLAQVTLQSLSNDFDPFVEIIDRTTGNQVITQTCAGPWNGTCSMNFQITFPSTGLYDILVYDNGADNTGNYNLNMTCILGGCPQSPKGLAASPAQISLATGGTQAFTLDAGSNYAGQSYLLVGSLNGILPGIPFGGVVLPLNFDLYLQLSIDLRNTTFLTNTFGTLSALGQASAALNLPKGLDPWIAGTIVHHAFMTIDTATLAPTFASNPVTLSLVP